jgi:hypothetical protein
MKLKHNKKRNTAFLYEVIIRETTKAVIEKNVERKKELLLFLKEYFNKNTTLGKDLSLYKTLCETHGLPPHSAEKLIYEAKKEHSRLDKEELFKEQSVIVNKMNKIFSKSIFSNFVPNYKSLATIQQIFNEETPLKKRILLEQNLLNTMVKRVNKRENALKPIDNLVFSTFTKKFNEKYSSEILEEQKKLIQKYLYSFVDNGVELKIYLNEEIGRLKDILKKSLNIEEIKSDQDMSMKAKNVLSILEEFKNEKIDKNLINKMYKIQNLAKEILN